MTNAYVIIIPLSAARGLLVDGIFRIAGTQDIMNSLKKMYDRGDDVDLNLIEDVHVIGGLLKLWLRWKRATKCERRSDRFFSSSLLCRELPEPVIPLNLYKDFIKVMRKPIRKGLPLMKEEVSRGKISV